MPSWFDATVQDLRHAFRGLLRNPGFALTVIVTAALGIGATTAVFSVVDHILFRPLPYRNEKRVVSLGLMAPLDTNEFMFASELIDLKRDPGPFERVTAFQAGAFACDLTEDNPARLGCLRAAADFLATLGVQPAIGRWFSRQEDQPNGPHVAVISHAFWVARFARNPGALGRSISIDGVPTQILGVLPADFVMPTLAQGDVFLPLALDAAHEHIGRAFRAFGLLKPGISITQAYARLEPHIARTMQTDVPPQFRREVTFRMRPVRDRQVGDVRLASLALLGAVIALLLLACANIANMLLARAAARDREFAVRSALGASWQRLARHSLTESLLIALAGGVAGCAIAAGLVRALASLAPAGLPYLDQSSLDLRVLLFALGGSVLTGLACGTAPALRRPGMNLIGGWRSTSGASSGLRSALVSVQVAVSLVLLSSAGLLLGTLWNLESAPLGLRREHVVTASFVLGRQQYGGDARQIAFFNQLETRLAELPGVEASAVSDSVPPSGGTRGRPLSSIDVEGRPPRPEGTGGMVAWRYVTPGYFRALGIPILSGRSFIDADRAADTFSIVLSASLARRLFPHGDGVGKRVLRGPAGEWFTVVGVADDVHNNGIAAAPDPEYYVVRKPVADFTFHNQEPPTGWRAAAVIVRTSVDPRMTAAALRSAITSIDPALPVQIETMDTRLGELTVRPRFNAILLSAFAAVGVLLAATGLFGVMAFLVTQRRQEIGVRVALGATAGGIAALTLAWAARRVIPGIVLGVAGALAAARLVRSLLYDVQPADWRVLAAAVLMLALVSLVAAAGPARRAAGVDPAEVLREQ